jgi:hypothetical protein
MALRDASDLVDRVKEGRGYRYRIMGPGEEHLDHLTSGDVASDERGRPKPRQRNQTRPSKSTEKEARSTTAKTAHAPSSKGTSRKRKPSTLGPKAAVTSLIESGFFKKNKTGPAVKDYLRKKRGFDFGTDQLLMAMLRLVRDGKLERDEGEDGQYEYKQT